MNIDFTNHAGFSAYVLLLMFSGLAMIVIGSPVVKRQRPLLRVLNLLFGIGFFCYGFYLAFLFDGGTYVIFFKAFILPVLLIVRSFGSRRPAEASADAPVPAAYAVTPPNPAWGAPTQPGYAAPGGYAQPALQSPYAQPAPQSPYAQPVPQPGYAHPGYAHPGFVEPSYAQPGDAQPGLAVPAPSQGRRPEPGPGQHVAD